MMWIHIIVGFAMGTAMFIWGFHCGQKRFWSDKKFKDYCAMLKKIIEKHQNDERKRASCKIFNKN